MVNYMQYLDKTRTKASKHDTQEKEEEQFRFRDIWPINPEFRDVNRRSQIIKVGSLVAIFKFIIAHMIILSFPLLTIVELVTFSLLLFFLFFKDRIFYFQQIFSFRQFDLFEKIIFWISKMDSHSVFFTHQADLMTIGLRIFRVEVIPENVSANIKQFVRSAAVDFQTINYQVVHQPLRKSVSQHSSGNKESQRTFIYFTVTKKFTGSVTLARVQELMRSLQEQSSTLSSRFIADFHHYKISLLSHTETVAALKTIFLHIPESSENKNQFHKMKGISYTQAFMKGGITLFFSIFNGWLVSVMWNNSWFSMGISLTTFILLISVWWKELRFHLSSKKVFNSDEVVLLDPFKDIWFFRFKSAPDTIYFQSTQDIIGGIHIFNVRQIPQPLYFSENKLYHPLIGKGISFSTTFSAVPISFNKFVKRGYKKLNRGARNHLCYNVQSEEERRIWMVQRAGMWNAEIIFSTQAYREEKELSIECLREIEMELQENSQKLSSLFNMQYSGSKLQPLERNCLNSALLMTALKTRYTRLGGSHLRYSLIQGLDFYPFLTIDNAFKKGIETKIAAEFNTPLHLDNDVSLGHTINTEFLEQEVTAGFSLNQSRQLLIMNGTATSREEVSLLLARNLIIKGEKVIIFDYTGNGSKLIELLRNDSLEDTILHYRLGQTLTIDPIHSEIPHDPQNIRFLNLMLDVYAICFKKDDHTVAMFKNSLSQLSTTKDNENLIGFRTLSLAIDSQQDWKKSPAVSSILSTLEDFTEQDSTYLFSHNKSIQGKSEVLDFLRGEKSVIIDISGAKDLEKQCFFTWLIIAKYIHYHSQKKEYVPKYFIIPNIDMVFDQYFFERKMKYGKIVKFIQPLVQAGHGFICTASQAHYLHSNLFSMFQNYIAFKANDTRDIAVLKNVLNLEELHGQGYYSKSRNEAYQVRYLMTMRPHEALMKRDDIYQSFPVEFNLNIVQNTPTLSWSELISHMKEQGYDIEDAERKIFKSAQKTVLEKDFGQYVFLIPEIINLLEGLQTVHQVGNLYRSKIAEELKLSIYPKLSKISKDKRQLKRMREEVLSILFSRGYLIESHPRQASGGQSIRTSYQVSPKLSTVLDDYYQAKRGISTDVEFEVVAQETENIPDFVFSTRNESKNPIIPSKQVQPILKRIIIDIVQWNLFQMHKSMAKQDYEQCLKIGVDLPEMFLSNLQAEIEQLPNINRMALRNDFISALCAMEGFPMTKEEVEKWQRYPQELVSVKENLQDLCQKLYEFHSQFASQLDSIISGEVR